MALVWGWSPYGDLSKIFFKHELVKRIHVITHLLYARWIYSLSGNIPDVTDIEEYVIPFFRGDYGFWGVQQGELLCFVERGD